MKINQGFNIVGVCKGIFTNEAGYSSLGVSEQSTDRYGDTQNNTHEISLSKGVLDSLRDVIESSKGKTVLVNCAVQMRRSQRTGNNYMSIFAHQNTQIQVI